MKNQKLCSGFGKKHTDKYGDKLAKITLAQIFDMAETPQQIAKEDAQWFIPSTLHTREWAKHIEHGEYHAVWIDIDQHTTLDAIKSVLAELYVFDYLAYSSSSAKFNHQKWRVIIPLATPATFEAWEKISDIFNDKFQAAGITPAPKNKGAGQLCYLPNRGEFYEYYINDNPLGGSFDWQRAFKNELADKKAQAAAKVKQQKHTRDESIKKASERAATGKLGTIDAFNAYMPIEQVAADCGYKQVGNKWLSPNSESGNAGFVTYKDNGWASMHGCDSNIGKPTEKGGVGGNAFDLFMYYQHGNNFDAALKAAGDMLGITKQNQREYMKNKDDVAKNKTNNETTNETNNESEKPKFSLKQFSITNQLDEMKTQMLNDVFVLDGIALLGQLTAIYAKPNTGKTLLTLWMLVESIKAGRIKGEDIYYINADDTYKGLITKGDLAKQYGFSMIAPSHKSFKVDDFKDHLQQLVHDDAAHGVVIVLDTLKKFTDLMDKKKGSEFMKLAREFASSGGTMIMLAHTNKNRTGEGKVVAGGTSDIGDDCDCAYTLDEVTGNSRTHKEVLFENFKSRGNVKRELLATYSIDENIGGYRNLFLSVEIASSGDIEQAKKERDARIKAAMDKDAIEAITDAINASVHKKNEIAKYAKENWDVPTRKTKKALDDYTGTTLNNSSLWRVQAGDKNSQNYYLLTVENISPEFYETTKNGD